MRRLDSPGRRPNLKSALSWIRPNRVRSLALAMAVLLTLPVSTHAQAASPWEAAVNVLTASFTGPIARGLSLVSIVIGGVTFAFGEGGSKRLLAGIVFGVGMAIGAVNFMGWLFP
jgi:type IV secretion system protein TrbC